MIDRGGSYTSIRRLTALNPATLGGHHLLEHLLPDGRRIVSTLLPFHIYDDGRMLATQWREDAATVRATTIVRLPAAAGTTADLKIAPINAGQPIYGYGPRHTASIRVENAGPDPVAGARLRYAPSGIWRWQAPVRLLNCRIEGMGTCPDPLDLVEPGPLALGSGSSAIFDYQILDVNYVAGSPKYHHTSGKFHIDPPFDSGDPDLDNNSASFWIALEDFRSSFE